MTKDIMPNIYYLCPDSTLQSSGIRRLYRHVDMLQQAGFQAAILHTEKGFRRQGMPEVPVDYLDDALIQENSIVVIPEGLSAMMELLQNRPGRRFVIALNWDYVFKNLSSGKDWRSYGIERALVVSPTIGQMIRWSMGLPVHQIDSSIDHQLYRYNPERKEPLVVFIQRKGINVDQLRRLLGSRNPEYINNIVWKGLDGLSESDYADVVCRASVFVNLSLAEGYPTSCLEAMAAGALVVGYDSVGGRDLLNGHGNHQNCILAPNGDYPALAYAMEPVLMTILNGQAERWSHLIQRGVALTSDITYDGEKKALINFWQEVADLS